MIPRNLDYVVENNIFIIYVILFLNINWKW